MKKSIVLMLLGAAMYVTAGTTFEFKSAADMNQTKDGFTVVLAQGNGQTAPDFKNSYYMSEYHPEMRLYKDNTITVSGEGLTNIQMVFALAGSKKEYAGLSANNGTLVSGGVSTDVTDLKVDTWTGEATQVVFTLSSGKQRQIKQLVINGEPIEINPQEEDPLPTAADLDETYVYEDFVTVSVPDTTITKKEYAFIDHNILVHCSQGSILKATDTTAAYFNCNAAYELSFTATKAIMGIAIDGYVRKAFSASCDKGELSYLTNEDYEMEGYPVLVIRNIDATSVTLSCPKQIRCFAVRVYFNANPESLDKETGVEDTKIKPSTTKILRDGQLLILREGKEYNALGY